MTALRAAVTSAVVTGAFGVGLVFLATRVLGQYGWMLFVGLPFAMGFIAVWLYAKNEPRTYKSGVKVIALSVLITAAVLLICCLEGAVCIAMAAPIAFALAVAGGSVAFFVLKKRRVTGSGPAMLSMVLMPCLMGVEYQAHPAPPLFSVTSRVIIDAPPEQVWPNVIAFSPITEQRDWILRTGIAYPTEARIDGRGVGAIRHCIFTTGEFVEPIEVWDEARLLKFSVARQPEPMTELSPYRHLHVRHLDGYLVSREGQIKLTPLPGGKTLLEGTTWYTDRIWPSNYWRLWSDYIIHRIHLRVLNHIKALSEAGPKSIALVRVTGSAEVPTSPSTTIGHLAIGSTP